MPETAVRFANGGPRRDRGPTIRHELCRIFKCQGATPPIRSPLFSAHSTTGPTGAVTPMQVTVAHTVKSSNGAAVRYTNFTSRAIRAVRGQRKYTQ